MSLPTPIIFRALVRPTARERRESMIQLTRLNSKPLVVNSDLIKFVEQSPDTLVTLITGEKIVVLEPAQEVLTRVIEFRRSVLRGLAFPWDPSSSHATITKSTDPGGQEPER
jgi:flagellar protein FlbD